MNNHNFDFRFVREVYKAISEANVDYIEIGYKNSKELFSPKEYGLWKFCNDEDIRKVTEGIESKTKISVMVDIGRVNMEDVKPASESPVNMIRVAAYVKDIDKAIFMVNHFAEKGYETTINIMAISKDQGVELDEALRQIEGESKVNVVYIVDSFGNLYQETTEILVKRFKAILKTREVGFHGHNNQQLAFSNTIEAIIHNANYLDATIYGIGRAAGNCPLELLIGFLKNPKFDIRPILDIISKEFIPLSSKIEWGYVIPYAIAGMMNEHPKAAMALRNSDKKENYRDFYETIKNTGLE
ncbi:MAG: nucleoid-structuring protein H-NS [Omnitrophica bacterium GWA2_41_15]|nr:MAG: nucleoid-structuring protein H-NS [Omnitrophica bacterium GWA2_41_15]HAZ10020.1 nucleoid-structuring protein H-NS [Candidatus Omnitrophota bacterium]